RKALLEGLGGQGLAVQGGGAGQVVEGGPGVVQPGEDQGPGEAGPGQFAVTANEAGLVGETFGGVGEEGLQGVRQLCYGGGHRKLRRAWGRGKHHATPEFPLWPNPRWCPASIARQLSHSGSPLARSYGVREPLLEGPD